jgi:hypothetical protein
MSSQVVGEEFFDSHLSKREHAYINFGISEKFYPFSSLYFSFLGIYVGMSQER